MFTKKEVAWILIAVIIFEFIIIFPLQKEFNLFVLLVPPIILLTNIISKKMVSGVFSIKIEHEIWKFQRWGVYKRSHFKKPIPIGLVIPFTLSILSLGLIKMLVLIQFQAENIFEKRVLKQIGFKRKSEINDSDLGFTAAVGFYSLIVLAIIGTIIGFPELTKYSIYYCLWNIIPFGNIDGSKVFYGSLINWTLILILLFISTALLIIF